MKHVVTKVLTVAVLLALAFIVYSQRTELVDCADSVNATLAAGLAPDTTCTFFGQDVTVPGRTTLLGPDSTTTTTTSRRRLNAGAWFRRCRPRASRSTAATPSAWLDGPR